MGPLLVPLVDERKYPKPLNSVFPVLKAKDYLSILDHKVSEISHIICNSFSNNYAIELSGKESEVRGSPRRGVSMLRAIS